MQANAAFELKENTGSESWTGGLARSFKKAHRALKDQQTNFYTITRPEFRFPELELGDDFEVRVPITELSGYSVDDFISQLPPRYAKSAVRWADYVQSLARIFCREFSASNCVVRFSEISDNQCSLFHADNVHVRLIQTLHGLGTEYLTESNLMRQGLGLGKNELIVREATKVCRANEGEIFFMRGDRWFRRAGLVHRSPPIEHLGLRRVYLCLDLKNL